MICEKLKSLPLNPYIINWIINFLEDRLQRVKVDGTQTDYVKINRGVPQGTVLGPVLFSIMINDIKFVRSRQPGIISLMSYSLLWFVKINTELLRGVFTTQRFDTPV